MKHRHWFVPSRGIGALYAARHAARLVPCPESAYACASVRNGIRRRLLRFGKELSRIWNSRLRCKELQNSVLLAEKKSANPVFGSPNRLCPPFCHPAVFSGLLSASGSGNRPNPLQNDDIQSGFLFLRRTGNKKGASEKGSFVRIKGLRLSFQCSEYQSNNRKFNLLHTLWRCLKSVGLLAYVLAFQYDTKVSNLFE